MVPPIYTDIKDSVLIIKMSFYMDVTTSKITSSEPIIFFLDVLKSSVCPANTAHKKTVVLSTINPK